MAMNTTERRAERRFIARLRAEHRSAARLAIEIVKGTVRGLRCRMLFEPSRKTQYRSASKELLDAISHIDHYDDEERVNVAILLLHGFRREIFDVFARRGRPYVNLAPIVPPAHLDR